MTLATILGVCLLVSPPAGKTNPVDISLPLSAELQQDSPQQNPPQPASENSAQPGSSVQPAHAPVAPSSSQSHPAAQTHQTQPAKPKAGSAASGTTKKSSAPKKHRRKPVAKTKHPDPTPPKTVVKNGGTTDPTVRLSPSLTDQQVSNQRQDITQLLANTDENLKKSSARELNANQQDMVKQILQYVEQAKTAGNAGDLNRARNLAFKARLLSEELTKP